MEPCWEELGLEHFQLRKQVYTSKDRTCYIEKAFNRSLGPVYLKFLPPSSSDREIQAASDLSKSPSSRFICKYYGCFGTDNGWVVIVQEACICDFDKLISERKKERLEEKDLWMFLLEAVEGLAFAQERVSTRQGVAHRDIKPANLLLGQDGHVRVCDFGVCRPNLPAETEELSVKGTPTYLSPLLIAGYLQKFESSNSFNVAHNAYKSDVFSLGYSMLEMALGRQVKSEKGLQGLEETIQQEVGKLEDWYSPEWREVILDMMNFSEENRSDFLQLRGKLQGLAGYLVPSEYYFYEWKHCALDDRSPRSAHIPLGPESRALPCGHCFCSLSCLQSYIDKQEAALYQAFSPVFCPICYCPIPHSLLKAALDARLCMTEVCIAEYQVILPRPCSIPNIYHYKAWHRPSQSCVLLTFLVDSQEVVQFVSGRDTHKSIAAVREEIALGRGVKVLIRDLYDCSLEDYAALRPVPEWQLELYLRKTASVLKYAQDLVRISQHLRPMHLAAASIYLRHYRIVIYDFEPVREADLPYREAVVDLGSAFFTFASSGKPGNWASQDFQDLKMPELRGSYSESLMNTLQFLTSGEIQDFAGAFSIINDALPIAKRQNYSQDSFVCAPRHRSVDPPDVSRPVTLPCKHQLCSKDCLLLAIWGNMRANGEVKGAVCGTCGSEIEQEYVYQVFGGQQKLAETRGREQKPQLARSWNGIEERKERAFHSRVKSFFYSIVH